MSKIRIMTDSAADIPPETAEALDIQVLHFPVIINDQEFYDGLSFTPQEFYEILRKEEKIPTHAQITPMQFVELYWDIYQQGYTDLIFTSINAKGSATNANAHHAVGLFHEEHPEAAGMNIVIIDSKTYTYAYGYAVVEAAKLRDQGKSVQEITDFIQDWVDRNRILCAPYSLKFTRKSGRVNATAAFLGDAIGLKPIISFPDGDNVILSKVRGEKAVIPAMLKMAEAEMDPDAPYFIIQAGLEDKNRQMTEEAEKRFGRPCECGFYIGPAIAINVGPDFVGIMYRKKEGA